MIFDVAIESLSNHPDTIGKQEALGLVDRLTCQETKPDRAGWFVGVHQGLIGWESYVAIDLGLS